MKTLAYILNAVFIIFVCIEFLTDFRHDGYGISFFIALILFSTVNVLSIMSHSDGRGIVSLFFERKRLEQEQKLENLKKNMGR